MKKRALLACVGFVVSMPRAEDTPRPPYFNETNSVLIIGALGETYINGNFSDSASIYSYSDLPITYQWLKNGRPVPGATNPRMDFVDGIKQAHAGVYQLRASNAAGSAFSRKFDFVVYKPQDGYGPEEFTIKPKPGETITLNSSARGPASWFHWSFGDSNVSYNAYTRGNYFSTSLLLTHPKPGKYTLYAGETPVSIFNIDMPDTDFLGLDFYNLTTYTTTFRVGEAADWLLGDDYDNIVITSLPPGLRVVKQKTHDDYYDVDVVRWRVVGTPTTAGFYTPTLTAYAQGFAGPGTTFTVQVNPRSLTEAQRAKSFSEVLAYVGVETSMLANTFSSSLRASNLPPGLRVKFVDDGYYITGIPSQPGFWIATLSGISTEQERVTRYLPITVQPMPLDSIGTYVGIVDPLPEGGSSDPSTSEGGSISLTVTGTGTFSGKLTLNATTVPFAGRFNEAGSIEEQSVKGTVRISRALTGYPSTLTLEVRNGGKLGATLVGEDSSGGIGFSTTAYGERVATKPERGLGGCYLFHATPKSEIYLTAASSDYQAYFLDSSEGGGGWSGGVVITTGGFYGGTLNLDLAKRKAQVAANLLPEGTSYGWFVIGNSNVVTLGGKLADGSAITSTGTLTASNRVFLHSPSRGRTYGLHGIIHLMDSAYDTSEAAPTGTLLWTRPASRGKLWADGFQMSIEAGGTRMIATNESPLGDVKGSDTQAELSFLSTKYPVVLHADSSLRIGPESVFTDYPQFERQTVDIRVKPHNGTFSGTIQIQQQTGYTTEGAPIYQKVKCNCEGIFINGYGAGFCLYSYPADGVTYLNSMPVTIDRKY